jgi:hypothetical protein
VAAADHGVTRAYFYQVLKADRIAIPSPPPPPRRLSSGDRVTLPGGRTGVVCARVTPNDTIAYVLPDDGGRVVTVSASSRDDETTGQTSK